MSKKMMKIAAATSVLVAGLTMVGCSTDAQVASHNLSKEAENFKVDRRVVFFNGITDKYLLSIEGRCSIEADVNDNQLEVTCKTSEDQFKKHFLGLSDNVSYFVEQLQPSETDVYHYKVMFRPEEIIPDIDLKTSGGN